jgi:hypothetical protein
MNIGSRSNPTGCGNKLRWLFRKLVGNRAEGIQDLDNVSILSRNGRASPLYTAPLLVSVGVIFPTRGGLKGELQRLY